MIRKLFIICFTCAFFAIAFYACNVCNKVQGDYTFLSNFELKTNRYAAYSNSDTLYTNDTVFLSFTMNAECVAQAPAWPGLFINTATATVPTYCPCGEHGFRNAVTGFKIFTDTAYAGYAAGTDISQLFTAFIGQNGSSSGPYTYYTANSFVQAAMDNAPIHNRREPRGALLFFITQKPGDSQLHKFTLQITAGDTVHSVSTAPFKWI